MSSGYREKVVDFRDNRVSVAVIADAPSRLALAQLQDQIVEDFESLCPGHRHCKVKPSGSTDR